MDILLKFAIHGRNLSGRPGVSQYASSERRKVQAGGHFKVRTGQNSATMGTEPNQIAFELLVLARIA
jgi:hypothetical protein